MLDMPLRQCSKCAEHKFATDEFFAPRGNGTLRRDCRECRAKYRRAWRLAHPESGRAAEKRYRATEKYREARKAYRKTPQFRIARRAEEARARARKRAERDAATAAGESVVQP